MIRKQRALNALIREVLAKPWQTSQRCSCTRVKICASNHKRLVCKSPTRQNAISICVCSCMLGQRSLRNLIEARLHFASICPTQSNQAFAITSSTTEHAHCLLWNPLSTAYIRPFRKYVHAEKQDHQSIHQQHDACLLVDLYALLSTVLINRGLHL